MLHHIEDEIIRTAETPDRDDKQQGDPQSGLLNQQKCGGKDAGDQEQRGFSFDPTGVSEVLHGKTLDA